MRKIGKIDLYIATYFALLLVVWILSFSSKDHGKIIPILPPPRVQKWLDANYPW